MNRSIVALVYLFVFITVFPAQAADLPAGSQQAEQDHFQWNTSSADLDSEDNVAVLHGTGGFVDVFEETSDEASRSELLLDNLTFLPLVVQMKTEGGDDSGIPYVVATNPPDGAANVSRNQKSVSITFSEPMQYSWSLSIDGGFLVGGDTVEYDPSTFTFTFTRLNPVPLPPNSVFTFKVNDFAPNFKDLDGNPAPVYIFSFTTEGEGGDDTESPYVVATNPTDGATDVSRNQKSVSITFSEPMQYSWSLSIDGGFLVGGDTVEYDPSTFTFTFTRLNPDPLPPNSVFTFKVNDFAPNFKDLAGNPASPYTFTFTTES